MTRKMFVALLMVASMTVTPARGEEFTCQEITDPDIQFQAELCSAHLGCRLVMGIHGACTKVKTFLNKLKNLSFGKETIDSSDVFDAAAPSTEGDETFNKISNSIKARYDKQPQKQIASGEFQNGSKWVYEGPMTNGERNGTGVLLTDSGGALRGDFVNGRPAGMGESFNEKSHKAGAIAGATMDGFGVERYADGHRYEGGYKDGVINGQGSFKWANGNEYTGNFVDGRKHGQGSFKWADGTRFEGEWRDDIKFSGSEVSPDGTRVEIANGTVVKSPQLAAAAQAKLEEEKKVQEGRDRLAREARERAAQARIAEEDRLESIKAAEARAYKRKHARKEAQDEQDEQETSEAIGNLLGVFAQMQQNKADRAQAQYDNQQRLAQAQHEQRRTQEQQRMEQARGSKSVQVPKSAPVNECLQINGERDREGKLVATNICNFPVQYSYCVVSTDRSLFSCKDPDGSDEGAAGVRAGGTTTFVGSSKGTGVRWMACKGGIGEVLPFLNNKGKRGCY